MALIDFDAGVGPGRRVDDFAHAVWCYADLTEAEVTVAEQARRTRIMCDTYGDTTPAQVVEALTARFHRARAQHEAAGRPRGCASSRTCWRGWPGSVGGSHWRRRPQGTPALPVHLE